MPRSLWRLARERDQALATQKKVEQERLALIIKARIRGAEWSYPEYSVIDALDLDVRTPCFNLVLLLFVLPHSLLSFIQRCSEPGRTEERSQ